MAINIKYLLIGTLCLLLSFCVGLMIGRKTGEGNSDNSSVSGCGLLSTTGVIAELKASPNDPDLVLSQSYVAKINGEEVKVPIVSKKATGTTNEPDSTDSSNAVQTSQGIRGTVTQTIDLTPVLSRYKKEYTTNWEVGLGYTCMNNRSYIPMSIQRNYSDDKALELTVLLKTDGRVDGAMMQHKWLIK